ncbi:unnamed protein product [Ectocarpus sp. 12 AP-2014]
MLYVVRQTSTALRRQTGRKGAVVVNKISVIGCQSTNLIDIRNNRDSLHRRNGVGKHRTDPKRSRGGPCEFLPPRCVCAWEKRGSGGQPRRRQHLISCQMCTFTETRTQVSSKTTSDVCVISSYLLWRQYTHFSWGGVYYTFVLRILHFQCIFSYNYNHPGPHRRG